MDREPVRIFRTLRAGRREKVQADPLEDDVVHEQLAAHPLIPVEQGRHVEGAGSVRIDGQVAAVIFRGDTVRVLIRDEMDVPDGLDARNSHEDADGVAGIEVRLPGEGTQLVRVDEAQQRLLETENLIGFAAGSQELRHAMDRDGRAHIVVHPVVDALQERTDIHVRVNLDFRAESHLDGFQERDVQEILPEIPVLPEEGQDAVPEKRLDIVRIDMVRNGLSVDVLPDDGQHGRVVLHGIQPFQLHQDVVIAVERRGGRGRLVGDMRDRQGPCGFAEPDVPHARNVLQDEFPVVVRGRRGVGEDHLRGEQRSFQGRGFPARPGEQVGHGGRGPVGQVIQREGQRLEDRDAGIMGVEIRPGAGPDLPDIGEAVFQQLVVFHRPGQARMVLLLFRHTVDQSAV